MRQTWQSTFPPPIGWQLVPGAPPPPSPLCVGDGLAVCVAGACEGSVRPSSGLFRECVAEGEAETVPPPSGDGSLPLSFAEALGPALSAGPDAVADGPGRGRLGVLAA